MNNKSTIFTVILFLVSICAFSQTEKQIRVKDVPKVILDYLKTNYNGYKKTTFFLETINDTVMYEAEIIFEKQELTLVFFNNGTLYELEKKEKFENLTEMVQTNIQKALSERFDKYSILEVEYLNPHMNVEHELQIKGEKNGEEKYFEFRFDKEGKVIFSKEIPLKPIQSMF